MLCVCVLNSVGYDLKSVGYGFWVCFEQCWVYKFGYAGCVLNSVVYIVLVMF